MKKRVNKVGVTTIVLLVSDIRCSRPDELFVDWLREMRESKTKLNQTLIQAKIDEVMSTVEIMEDPRAEDTSGHWFKIWSQR